MNLRWSSLSRLQRGNFAETFAKISFMMEQYEVFSTDVDEKGVDFVAKSLDGKYYEVQVKSVIDRNYTFVVEDKFFEELLICLILFEDNTFPKIYLFKKKDWNDENYSLLRLNKFDNATQKEYGFHLSKKYDAILEQFKFSEYFNELRK